MPQARHPSLLAPAAHETGGRPDASAASDASHVSDHAHDHGHAPDHAHDHGHAPDHGHPHDHAHGSGARALWIALILTGIFGVVEAFGGWLSHSLALISDAGHMVTDAASFVIALIATAVARRPPSRRASYGYARAEVIAAFLNAIGMLGLIVWIAIEAVQRLLAPAPVSGPTVMVVAAGGLVVNVIVAWVLARGGGGINAQGALLHVMGDMLGSVAALTAGAVVLFTGWTPIDPILSIVVALLILRSTWALLGQSTGVLMEHVPPHLSFEAIGHALCRLPGVTGVHDLHVWQMGSGRVALSAHLTLVDGSGWPRLLSGARRVLIEEFGIEHVTLQPDWVEAPQGRRVIPVASLPRTAGREGGPHWH